MGALIESENQVDERSTCGGEFQRLTAFFNPDFNHRSATDRFIGGASIPIEVDPTSKWSGLTFWRNASHLPNRLPYLTRFPDLAADFFFEAAADFLFEVTDAAFFAADFFVDLAVFSALPGVA